MLSCWIFGILNHYLIEFQYKHIQRHLWSCFIIKSGKHLICMDRFFEILVVWHWLFRRSREALRRKQVTGRIENGENWWSVSFHLPNLPFWILPFWILFFRNFVADAIPNLERGCNLRRHHRIQQQKKATKIMNIKKW